MPRSAFAADLLPSPFYPNPILPGFGTTFLLPSAGPTTTGVFQWPTAASAAPPPAPVPATGTATNAPQPFRAAPMLAEEDAPDLLRRESSEKQQSTTAATATNGLADLTQAAAALASHQQTGEGDAGAGARGVKRGAGDAAHEGGGGEVGQEGDEAGGKKHRVA
jgi:hypothetical protein